MEKHLIRKSLPLLIPLYILIAFGVIGYSFDLINAKNTPYNIIGCVILTSYITITYYLIKTITRK